MVIVSRVEVTALTAAADRSQCQHERAYRQHADAEPGIDLLARPAGFNALTRG